MRSQPRGDLEAWRGRPVVVTGATGFIGAALAEALLARGAYVFGIDRAWPSPSAAQRERAERLVGADRFTPLTVDMRDAKLLFRSLSRHRASAVFHLAARPGVRDPDIDATYLDNVVATGNLLSALAELPPIQVLFASSSSVYGVGSPLPFVEDAARGAPASHYARSKLLGEVALRRFHLRTGAPVAIARLFNVYGPRCRPDTVPLLFARRLLAGDPVTLASGGAVLRDFTYIDDVVDALILLAEATHGGGLETVNVGTGVRTSIAGFLALLGERLGVAPREVVAAPAHPLDVPATQADTTRLAELTGWRPEVPLAAGLAVLAAWLTA